MREGKVHEGRRGMGEMMRERGVRKGESEEGRAKEGGE